MELPEKVFEVLYNILVQQNKRLFIDIALRERISYDILCQKYIPTRKQFRTFIQSSSSSLIFKS